MQQYIPGKWYDWVDLNEEPVSIEDSAPPVPVGMLVDVRHRDGDRHFRQEAGLYGYAEDWSIDVEWPERGDIIAFRICEEQ